MAIPLSGPQSKHPCTMNSMMIFLVMALILPILVLYNRNKRK